MCINLLKLSSSFSERSSPSLIRRSLQSESIIYHWNMNCPDGCDGVPPPTPPTTRVTRSDRRSLTYKVRHLAESMEYRVAENLTTLNLVNIFPAIYESRRFITVFKKSHTYPTSEPAQSSRRHSVSYFIITRWFKYDRDWFVCKQAALRSSCATLREWSHNLHPSSCSG